MCKRLICVSNGTPQMEYVGYTDVPEGALDEGVAAGQMLTLTECRCMRTILMPTASGVEQSNILTPIGIARGGITLRVSPRSYWWPDQDADTLKALHKQLEVCCSAEISARCADAGLVAPDGPMKGKRLA